MIVKDCIQENWKACNGESKTSWILWNDGYKLDDSKVCASTKSSDYLQKDVTAENFIPNSAVSASVLSAIVSASVATNASPISASIIVSQMQSISCISMFNINTPDNVVSYSKGMNIQATLKSHSSRLLSASYVSLVRLGYYDNTFIQNQLYLIILIGIIALFHIIVLVLRYVLKWPKCLIKFF